MSDEDDQSESSLSNDGPRHQKQQQQAQQQQVRQEQEQSARPSKRQCPGRSVTEDRSGLDTTPVQDSTSVPPTNVCSEVTTVSNEAEMWECVMKKEMWEFVMPGMVVPARVATECGNDRILRWYLRQVISETVTARNSHRDEAPAKQVDCLWKICVRLRELQDFDSERLSNGVNWRSWIEEAIRTQWYSEAWDPTEVTVDQLIWLLQACVNGTACDKEPDDCRDWLTVRLTPDPPEDNMFPFIAEAVLCGF